jgi:formylglycine-generating enzyme required for sulfatase activity
MKRLFCFAFVAAFVTLASDLPVHAQAKKDPSKNFTNSIGMKFVWIPPGNLIMGSPKDEKERRDDEIQHKVTLTKGFYMGVFPVTEGQWKAIMGNYNSGGALRWMNVDPLSDEYQVVSNWPKQYVYWDDCSKFCKTLQRKDKKPYRLPTEAEWEYACRAGTTTPYHFGEAISTDLANYDGNITYGNSKKGKNREMPTPVGSFPPNAWGLHDMHGNVFQWCQDGYGDYPKNDVIDPQGADSGWGRVLRGGAFDRHPNKCRSACRSHCLANRGSCFGFRVCFSVD